jgi:hypothetical protein
MLVLTVVLQQRNRIGDAGACAIAEALKQNNSMRVLGLVRRSFGIFFLADFAASIS